MAETLKERYREEVVPEMKKRLGYENDMEVPRIEKVVINMGVGDAIDDPKALDAAVSELALIAGQKPAITRAKRSVAAFKVRAGMPIGCKVTLRGDRMYDFVDKLFHVALPRVRDFRGVSPGSFDGRGNFSLGLKEQLVFPEIDYDSVQKVRGMDVTITTTAKTDEEARVLLTLMGLPLRESA